MDGVVWPKDAAGTTVEAICTGVDTDAPGPWIGPAEPNARLEGG